MDKAWSLIKDQYIDGFKGDTRLAVFRFLQTRSEKGNCEFYFEDDDRKDSILKTYGKYTEYDPELHIAILILIPKGGFDENVEGSLLLFDNITFLEATNPIENEIVLEGKSQLTRRCRSSQS